MWGRGVRGRRTPITVDETDGDLQRVKRAGRVERGGAPEDTPGDSGAILMGSRTHHPHPTTSASVLDYAGAVADNQEDYTS